MTNEIYLKYAVSLHEQRTGERIKLGELANDMYADQGYKEKLGMLSKKLNGHESFNIWEVKRLCSLLKVSPKELLFGADE